MKDTENTNPEPFTVIDLIDEQEEIRNHNWALRAFGALLETADLGEHFSELKDAQMYKIGLNKIVEMYIESQEEKLNQVELRYRRSPEAIIRDAWMLYENLKCGVHRNCETIDRINPAVKKLNAVIVNFGNDYPKAEVVRDMLVNLKDSLSQTASEDEQRMREAG